MRVGCDVIHRDTLIADTRRKEMRQARMSEQRRRRMRCKVSKKRKKHNEMGSEEEP